VDIRTLRYFVVAAETENLSRASERLNIVQSAVSHQIRGLEQELGAQLFTRTGRRIHLSEIGKVFLEGARTVLEAVEVAKLRVVQAAKGTVGELRIGFETNSRCVLASEALLAFRDGFPDVTVHLSPMSSGQILEALASGGIDAGFAYFSEISPEFGAVTLQKADWLLALPQTHRLGKRSRITLKDLKDEPFIWRPREVSPVLNDHMVATLLAGGLIPNIVEEAYNETMMINLVAAGLGICFVVDTVIHQWPGEAVIFRSVEDFSLPLSSCLLWRKDNQSLTLSNLILTADNMSKVERVRLDHPACPA
jgi:DNA-binding transcriptional LysR family regulator